MKKIVVMLIACIAVGLAFGDVYLNWTASAGFYFADELGNEIGGILPNVGDSTIAQLVYTPDGTRDQAWIGGGFAPGGNNEIWDAITVTNTGDDFEEYAFFGLQPYQDTFADGSVYVRIFEKDAIEAGDYYFASAVYALVDLNPGDTPPPTRQLIQGNDNLAFGDPINFGTRAFIDGADTGSFGYAQVIPEPATALMLIVGGLGAFIFRRSKMRAQREEA